MTVRREADVVYLEGRCLAEDAEELLLALAEDGPALVDLSGALRLHMAVVQVLVVLKPGLRGAPQNPFAVKHLMSLLT